MPQKKSIFPLASSPQAVSILAPRLGVNLDHIVTLRQLRFTPYPDLLEASRLAAQAGADQITVHLREDRRHIQDLDVKALRKQNLLPLNLEMAASSQMLAFALKIRPDWVCLVPEKRAELTTEGGLDLDHRRSTLARLIAGLQKAKIRVSLFVEPSLKAMKSSAELGVDAVELHTGTYCLATQGRFGARSPLRATRELARIAQAAELGKNLGLHVHAGHGFDLKNVRPVVEQVPLIEEYNIGHAIVCRSVFVGLEQAVREMVAALTAP